MTPNHTLTGNAMPDNKFPSMDETARRILAAKINAGNLTREELEVLHPREVWDTSEMKRAFTLLYFAAPYVHVVRNSDNVDGILTFQHHPRFYYQFQESPSP